LTHPSPFHHPPTPPTERIRQPFAAVHAEQFSQSISQRFRPIPFDQFGNLVQALVQAFGIVAFHPTIYKVFTAVRFRSGRRGRRFKSCHSD
jgi:hypothetical protein